MLELDFDLTKRFPAFLSYDSWFLSDVITDTGNFFLSNISDSFTNVLGLKCVDKKKNHCFEGTWPKSRSVWCMKHLKVAPPQRATAVKCFVFTTYDNFIMSYNAIINTKSLFYAEILLMIQHLASTRQIAFSVRQDMKTSSQQLNTTDASFHFCKALPLSRSRSLSNTTFTSELSSSLKRFTRTCLSVLTPLSHSNMPLYVAPAFARTHSGLIRTAQPRLLASLITLEQQAGTVCLFMFLFPW